MKITYLLFYLFALIACRPASESLPKPKLFKKGETVMRIIDSGESILIEVTDQDKTVSLSFGESDPLSILYMHEKGIYSNVVDKYADGIPEAAIRRDSDNRIKFVLDEVPLHKKLGKELSNFDRH